MNAKIAALQKWINAKGHKPQLIEDGVGGPKTRQALYDVFANRAALPITAQQEAAFASRLGGTVKQLRAVSVVESAGGAYLPSGHSKALWERHYFFKRWQIRIPLISDPSPGGYTLDADRDGLNDSWEKLCEAAMLNPIAAFESASFGKFQIMGAWWERLGYNSSLDFAWSMRDSEAGHYEALVRYIERFGLLSAFRALSSNPDACRPFAKGYNGGGYEKYAYHQKLAAEMRRQG